MLCLPLVRFADAEALLNRKGNPFAPLNVASDARLRSWQ
jgi:hypothetical protein